MDLLLDLPERTSCVGEKRSGVWMNVVEISKREGEIRSKAPRASNVGLSTIFLLLMS